MVFLLCLTVGPLILKRQEISSLDLILVYHRWNRLNLIFEFQVSLRLLSGEKSPFVGYNCLLFQKPGKSGTVGMACWGKGIPITEALVSDDICHTSKYLDPDYPLRNFLPLACVS